MTIRSGGRPRDPRVPGHSYEPDAYATESGPERFEPVKRSSGRGHRGGGRASGFLGLLKFVLFAAILAGLVLVVSLTALRPVLNGLILGWAADNPAALGMPFVADLVREDLGPSLTEAASSDPAQVPFVVEEGDTASTIGARLEDEGLIRDRRAFVFVATDRDLAAELQQGEFVLRRNMTPDQLVSALLAAPEVPYVQIDLRTGLRLEQITAKLQTLPLEMDVREFYDLAKEPPAALIADYPWLSRVLQDAPDNPSLEGFLWPASYRVLPDTTPEELVRLMLDKFIEDVGERRLDVPTERGLGFYDVLSLASIVEREAVLDEERPRIAGVYQNRIDGIKGVRNRQLNADPTVFYAIDTLALQRLAFERWDEYAFWSPPGVALREVKVPPALAGYQTYVSVGLIPGPIATPTLASIDAALEPDTADKFIYFVAIPDGGGAHAFAKTAEEFGALLEKYGY
ncbi:MAG: endolytic transglycosylase MltG [Candidatus Limnocylindrales bacterium]